jgi:hypothetical protein
MRDFTEISNDPREKNLVDSELETLQANDAVPLDRSSAVDIGYPKFPERFC